MSKLKLVIILFTATLFLTGCVHNSTNETEVSQSTSQNKEQSTDNSNSLSVQDLSNDSTLTGSVDQNQVTNNQDITMQNKIITLKTSKGDIKVELFLENAPITAGNFLKLAQEDFYDGITFHRVIPEFMIQGGDPLSKDSDPNNDGTGGPGYFIKDEFFEGSTNLRGTLSMANAGPGTGGSQFFINIADNTFLDYDKEPATSKHAVFGKVIEGMDIVNTISLVEKSNRDRPIEDVVIQDVVVE